MAKIGFAFFLMLGTLATALGQRSADLGAKYPEVASYEVRPGVLMVPKYAANGQVCEMVLERRQKTETGIVFGSSFSENEVKELVDELVPDAERGKNLTELLNTSVDGGFITTEYTYENILVRVHGITRPQPSGNKVVVITWRKRVCGQQPQPTASSPRTVPAAKSSTRQPH